MNMNKTLLVLRYEIGTAIRSRSFLVVAFGLPLIGALIFLAISLLRGDGAGVPAVGGGSSARDKLEIEGYVDRSGLIQKIHPDVPAGILIPYPDEDSARQALAAGEITAYYLIPADYLASGELIYVDPSFSLAADQGQSWVMRQTLFANLLGNDPERIARAAQPIDLQVTPLAPQAVGRDRDNPLTQWVPYATTLMLVMVINMSASLLLSSVGNEKKNRVIEILLSSVHPRQMLAGKIVGLGVLGLLQTAIWLGVGYTLLRVSGRTFSWPAGFELPPSILVWGMVFFLLGYAVYASLMSGLGALAPSLREATQSAIVVIWPMLIPMFFYLAVIEHPQGALAISLSLFPLTAPVAMMTRLVTGHVPWWQPPLAAVLLVVTAVWVVRAVAGMFRAQVLLSGQPLSTRRFLAALLGRGL